MLDAHQIREEFFAATRLQRTNDSRRAGKVRVERFVEGMAEEAMSSKRIKKGVRVKPNVLRVTRIG